jgi:Protein of unknown function (DUF3592)
LRFLELRLQLALDFDWGRNDESIAVMRLSPGYRHLIEQILGFILLTGFILGLFLIVTIPFEMIQMARAERWPSRQGLITTSFASRRVGFLMRSYWAADICGIYLDNRVGFCISRIRYGGFRFDEGEAESRAAVAKYRVGSQINVYYAPDDPTTTILEPHGPWFIMAFTWGLGIGLMLIPILVFKSRRVSELGKTGENLGAPA